ncbi:MAG: hypothetical protein NWF07_13790 [Candidatus Bathyarchaeota archaeon]|nr:hypothetical protein [Candidatus Bathyarchaeota archaeon]
MSKVAVCRLCGGDLVAVDEATGHYVCDCCDYEEREGVQVQAGKKFPSPDNTPKCVGCGGRCLVTETFAGVSRLDPSEYYYQCVAMVDDECLEDQITRWKLENKEEK